MAVSGNLFNLETDPANQTTIGGIGTEGTSNVSNADDTFRELAAEIAAFIRDIGGATTVGGSADAISLTSSGGVALSAYFDGMVVAAIPTAANTITNPTMNFGTVGAKQIKKIDDTGAESALAVGDIIANRLALFRYRSSWASGAGAWEYSPLGFSEVYTSAEKTKLDGIETAATADQTGAEIKAAYEAEADTNAFTDALKNKLDNIEALADVTDAANVAAAGAVMESDTTTAAMGFVIDEDNMSSNLDTKIPTQQSVKAYVDSATAGIGALVASNNLSDVGDKDASRVNLLPTISAGGLNSAAMGTLIKVTHHTSNGTHTFETESRYAIVEVQGAGGGASGGFASASGNSSAGKAGGAGGYARKVIDLTSITSATITVGSGGAGNANGTAASSGGNSSYADGTNTLTGNGGTGGGAAADSSVVRVTAGGAGGTATGGDMNITGQTGGGSFAAPKTTWNTNTNFLRAGDGGNSVLGIGGRGAVLQTNSDSQWSDGDNGSGYGSGGGAGSATGDSSLAQGGDGGDGGDGIVIIYELG